MLILSYVLAADSLVIFLQSTFWPSHQSMSAPYSLWTSFSLTLHCINSEIDPFLMTALPPVRQSVLATPTAPSMDHPPPSKPSSKSVPHVSRCKSTRSSWGMTSITAPCCHLGQSLPGTLSPDHREIEGGHTDCSSRGCMNYVQSWDSEGQGQVHAQLGTGASQVYWFIYFMANNVLQGGTHKKLAQSPMAHEA